MRHALAPLALVACVGSHGGSGAEPIVGPVAIEDCAPESTRGVLACSWNPPGTAADFATCDEVAYVCELGWVDWDCARSLGRASDTLASDCARLEDESALRRAYVACGERLSREDWILDADAVREYVETCAH